MSDAGGSRFSATESKLFQLAIAIRDFLKSSEFQILLFRGFKKFLNVPSEEEFEKSFFS